MSQWVSTINGEVMPIQTLRRLTSSEMNSDAMKKRMEQYDAQIKKRLGDSTKAAPQSKEPYPEHEDDNDDFIPYEGLYGEKQSVLPEDDDVDLNHDLLISAEVLLP